MVEPIHPRPPRVSVLLTQTLTAWPNERINFGAMVDAIHGRGFGALLLLIALPCMVPLPVGFMGGIFGTLLILLGLQMTAGFDHPWLPKFVRRLEMPKLTAEKFVDKLDPWLGKIERLCSPSWLFFHTKTAQRFSGLLLTILGVELALPLPMTNIPFAILLIGYAMALIERDGRWLALMWFITISQLVAAFFVTDWIVLQLSDVYELVRKFVT
jgi:hypothetical protein